MKNDVMMYGNDEMMYGHHDVMMYGNNFNTNILSFFIAPIHT